jgi:hypothetical protein
MKQNFQMKKILLLFSLILWGHIGFSQSVSCQSLQEEIEEAAELESTATCVGSSALVKAEYYTLDGDGFVIVYLKSNQYDFSGRPYVFCNISSARWSKFVSEGRNGSWGKAFNTYIRDYLCNCN